MDYRYAKINPQKKMTAILAITIVFIVLSCSFSSAQTAEKLPSFSQIGENGSNDRLSQLLSGVHPAFYITNGEISQYGTHVPRIVYCDAASLNMLYLDKSDYLLVELIRIKLDNPGDEKLIIDLEQAQSFSNLNYILLEFGFDLCGGGTDHCLQQVATRMVKFDETPVSVLYTLSNIE